MDFGEDRESPAADRHGCDESDMRAACLRPVDENDGPFRAAKQPMRDRKEEEQPIADHLRIPEQAVDFFYLMLRQSRASKASADRRWAQPAAPNDSLNQLDDRPQSHRVHYRAASADQLTYHRFDAHPL